MSASDSQDSKRAIGPCARDASAVQCVVRAGKRKISPNPLPGASTAAALTSAAQISVNRAGDGGAGQGGGRHGSQRSRVNAIESPMAMHWSEMKADRPGYSPRFVRRQEESAIRVKGPLPITGAPTQMNLSPARRQKLRSKTAATSARASRWQN